MFSTRTFYLLCSQYRYTNIVHSTKTIFTNKTGSFPNISPIFWFLGVSFAPMNATKYLFCCVRFIIRSDAVKMCLHSVDSLRFLDFVPSGTVQPVRRSRLLLDSTGGGGYGRADCWAVILPSTDVANYHPTTLKNIAKNKKGAIIYVR